MTEDSLMPVRQPETPQVDGPNGRRREGQLPNGRFAPGNRLGLGGGGSALARRSQSLRAALMRAVSRKDIDRIAAKMVEQAISGDVPSAKLVLAYVIGDATSIELVKRLESIEVTLTRFGDTGEGQR